jgi:hypothetical protein
MAATIPNTEPTEITAGDTASWTRSLSNYPADEGWVLSYAFLKEGEGQQILITGTDDGGDHLVELTPATTQLWLAGTYNGQGYVTKTATGERHRIWSGQLVVVPDFVTAGQIDTRSKARIILDFIENSWEKVGSGQIARTTVGSVSFEFRSIDDLIKGRDYWLARVTEEETIAAGGTRKMILARFRSPTSWPPQFPWP